MILKYNDLEFDLTAGVDISISFHSGFGQVNAFHAPPFRIQPVKEGDFVGSTKMGGPVNFFNFQCNPHGNGTHTECLGHISTGEFFVNECIDNQFRIAELLSVFPNMFPNGDKVIEPHHLEALSLPHFNGNTLIIRTLPNDEDKKERNYSGTNPPYLLPQTMQWIVDRGIEHLLVDIPSVDREMDEGKLSAHKIFWNFNAIPKENASITELIFVPNHVKDGIYLLAPNISNIKLDAAPSRPIIYPILKS